MSSITHNGYYVKYTYQEILTFPNSKCVSRPKDKYNSACPFCAEGTDRFVFWGHDGFYWCNHCGKRGWTTDAPGSRDAVDWQIERKNQRAIHKEIIARLEKRQIVDQYHANLTTDHRNYLINAYGLTNDIIDQAKIGYCPKCPTCLSSDSLTIPYWHINGKANLTNLRHRLLHPPVRKNGKIAGKYRPEQAGLVNTIYNIDLLLDPTYDVKDFIIIVEGEFKALVLFYGFGFPVVGIPGANSFNPDWGRFFAGKKVCLALDPDVKEPILQKTIDGLQAAKEVKVASLPFKPDDMLVHLGYSITDLWHILEMSRPV